MNDAVLLTIYREAVIESVVAVAGEYGEVARRVIGAHLDQQHMSVTGLRAVYEQGYSDGR